MDQKLYLIVIPLNFRAVVVKEEWMFFYPVTEEIIDFMINQIVAALFVAFIDKCLLNEFPESLCIQLHLVLMESIWQVDLLTDASTSGH